MKNRILYFLILIFALPVLACSTPARLLRNWQATPTPLPSPTLTSSATPRPSSTPTVNLDPSAQPAIHLEDKTVDENDAEHLFEIYTVFPYLAAGVPNADVFNSAMADFEETTLSAFRSDAAHAAADPSASPGSSLQSRYDVVYNQNELLSLQMWISYYMKGAAHPGTFSTTFNYDLSSGKMLALDDLFLPGAEYLPILAQYCQDEIQRRDSAFWPDGAGADPANYKSWNLTENGLQITFDEYQVAPYAAGPQIVLVPYPALEGLVDPGGPLGRTLQ